MKPEGKEIFGEYIVTKDGQIFSKKVNRFLTPHPTKSSITLCFFINGKKVYRTIDRLVAIAYIPNPKGYRFIHHINGNLQDNRAENLEWWYSTRYKDNHQIEYKGKKGRNGFPIEGLDDNGKVVKYYQSLRAASRDGHSATSVSRCLRGEIKTFDGLRWRYAEDVRGV